VLAKDAGTVRSLLDAGARPDVADENGLTPLHNAAGTWWDESVASLLLDAGADVNAMASRGTTPLGTAVGTRNAEAVAFLLRRGALPRAEQGLSGSAIEYLRCSKENPNSALASILASFAAAGYPLADTSSGLRRGGTSFFLGASLMNHAGGGARVRGAVLCGRDDLCARALGT
jgi:hypothetical protein